jgi:hypothetical protein
MKRNKTKLQGFISAIFAFLLTIIFVVLFICIGFKVGVFNDRIILSKVNESNYYNEIHEQLNERAEAIVIEAGLPTAVLQDVITLERVYIGGKYYIEDTLSGEVAVANTEKVRENLTRNIEQYLAENEIVETEELHAGINEIISNVEQEYKRGIEFQFINYITIYKFQYLNIMKIVVPLLLVLAGILCFFLVRMQTYKHRGVRYIAYAMLASSIMTILTSAFLLLTRQYEKVDTSPDYYREFLIVYLNWDIKVFLFLGGIGIVISIILINLVGFMKNNIHNNRKLVNANDNE